MNLIEIEHLTLEIYGARRRILHDINWRIGRGEKWVLYGPNGSGKSKLAEVIAGYRHPTAGLVRRFGAEPGTEDIRELRKRIGYAGSAVTGKFSPEETVLDTVISGLFASIGLFAEPGHADTHRALDLLAQTSLLERQSSRLDTLSDGERQKVMICRAMISAPELLILDEPCTGLDFAARENLLASIDRLTGRNGPAVIYITHHIEEITPLFTRILMLKEGTVLFKGDFATAVKEGMFAKIFNMDLAVERRGDRYFMSHA